MNLIEEAFAVMAREQGWEVTKRGWPDFLCRRNGELMAVEVKGPHDGLSRQQWDTINDLRAAGIPTFVWGPDTGFVEVGGPVTESIHSLKATIAQLRQLLAERDDPKPESLVFEWWPDPTNADAVRAVANECLRSHPDHLRRGSLTFCEYLLVEGSKMSEQDLSDWQWRRSYWHAKRRMERYQHDQMHNHTGLAGRCSFCSVQKVA